MASTLHESNLFEVMIHDHDMIGIHGFALWIHGYMILWYNSRNLNQNPLSAEHSCLNVTPFIGFHIAWIEPFWSHDSWPRYDRNSWIRIMNPRVHDSLIQFPQPKSKPFKRGALMLKCNSFYWLPHCTNRTFLES